MPRYSPASALEPTQESPERVAAKKEYLARKLSECKALLQRDVHFQPGAMTGSAGAGGGKQATRFTICPVRYVRALQCRARRQSVLIRAYVSPFCLETAMCVELRWTMARLMEATTAYKRVDSDSAAVIGRWLGTPLDTLRADSEQACRRMG